MKTKITLLLAALLLSTNFLHAQKAPLPAHYAFKKDQDYKDYLDDVMKCMNWLLKTPLKENDDERQNVNAFVLQWMTGTPDVTITVPGYVTDFSKKNPDLLLAWMCGYALNDLNSSDTTDAQNNLAGVKSAISLYQLGGDLKKDRKADDLIDKDKDGTLADWVTKELKEKK